MQVDVSPLSLDKDLMQLVGGGVEMFDAMKQNRIDQEGVHANLVFIQNVLSTFRHWQVIAWIMFLVRLASVKRQLC